MDRWREGPKQGPWVLCVQKLAGGGGTSQGEQEGEASDAEENLRGVAIQKLCTGGIARGKGGHLCHPLQRGSLIIGCVCLCVF